MTTGGFGGGGGRFSWRVISTSSICTISFAVTTTLRLADERGNFFEARRQPFWTAHSTEKRVFVLIDQHTAIFLASGVLVEELMTKCTVRICRLNSYRSIHEVRRVVAFGRTIGKG